MSEIENQELKKSAFLKVSDFFTEAPNSIKQTIELNNQSFWNKLEEKNKVKKELQSSQLKQSNLTDHQADQDPKLDLQPKIVQIENNSAQNGQDLPNDDKDISPSNQQKELSQEIKTQNNEKKIDQLKSFFMQSTTIVSNRASNSYDQLKISLKKKEEEKKNKQQKQELIKQNTQNEIQDQQKEENKILPQEKDDPEVNRKKIIEQSKQEITEGQLQEGNKSKKNNSLEEQNNIQQQVQNPDLNQKNEILSKNQENYEIEEVYLNEQGQQIEQSQQNQDTQQNESTPQQKQIQKLGGFFSNSTNAVSIKAQESYHQFKEKLLEKQKQKTDHNNDNESIQKMNKENEDKMKESSQSLEKQQPMPKVSPNNSHYEDDTLQERKKKPSKIRDSNNEKSFNNQSEEEQNFENEETDNPQLNQKNENDEQKNASIKKFTIKRKNSGSAKQRQNISQNQNPNQNHINPRLYVEKEIDKEEKLREVARKKREIELQLLQVNQELIHLRRDLSNEAQVTEQYIVKKGKLIPPIKEQNQVKAMIQISDDKKALEDALSLVRRMNQEKKLKEQQQLQKMHYHSSNFKNKILAYRERDEENFYQRELQKKNIVLTRMQEYELKKIEGQRLQDASRQFVKDLMEKGPNKGKISEVYKSKINEIERELDVNLSQVRQSKLQTPLLNQKKQNLQNVRNLQEQLQTESDNNSNLRETDEYQLINEQDDEKIQEPYQKSVQQNRDNSYQQYSNKMQSSMPVQKKNYGSIFTKRVINYDQRIKNQDRLLSEEKKNLYEKRMNYSKVVKYKYTPKHILDSYNFYQDALYLKQKMKASDEMSMDDYK